MELEGKKCVPCEGGVKPLEFREAKNYLSHVDEGWEIKQNPDRIEREVKLKDFASAMQFLNNVAQIAESEGHHPDFEVHYNKVKFSLQTHAINGLHENDFILAAKIDSVLKEEMEGS